MLPWVDQLIDDFDRLHHISREVRGWLVSPTRDTYQQWFRYIAEWPEWWKRVVDEIYLNESRLDRSAGHARAPDLQPFTTHTCYQCTDQPSFATRKALEMHCRVVHDERNAMRMYAESSGVCQVCKTSFVTRLRLMAHLSDRRAMRSKCRDEILSNPDTFSETHTKALDELDQA